MKKPNRYRTIDLRTHVEDFRVVGDRLTLWKKYGLTNIPIRGLESFEDIITARIVRRASGWYFQVIVATKDKTPIKRIRTQVGIDLGIKNFLVDSNGKCIKTPDRLKKISGKLTPRQQERIKNQRKDFLHKLSHEYAKNHLVAVEKLDIQRMVKDGRFSKSIYEAAWYTFNRMLAYKLRTLGHYLVEVDAAYTTQTCSECGAVKKKKINERVHKCPCGYVVDRDFNAARNILKLGRATALVS